MSFNVYAAGKPTFVRIGITPLPPGCCQSLPARISHGLLLNPRAFVTGEGILDQKPDGAGLRLTILNELTISELKAPCERLMQLC